VCWSQGTLWSYQLLGAVSLGHVLFW
jgi:hypothetical protein